MLGVPKELPSHIFKTKLFENTKERGKGNYFLIAFCLIVLWLFLKTAIKINWNVECDCFYNGMLSFK